jgi:mono/diheme cytochrome c family protein
MSVSVRASAEALRRFAPLAIVAIVALTWGTRARGDETPVGYYADVKPILAAHCLKCHGGEAAKGGLRLDSREGVLGGGDSGEAAIVPEDSAHSELLLRVTSRDGDDQMPPKGARLSEREVDVLRRWIDGGAPWPARDDYWAFQPPRRPAISGDASAAQRSNPIDSFIDARLVAAGIAPAPVADRRTLLRRAFADLIGLPPTPEEADTFLDDQSPDSYEKLIDRLLADPRYGERWARHWLDLVRYGESDGYEDDRVRPHAWRYRDYVIRSFNADKPYDRFVQEQIAGDELFPDDPDAWVATGFARLGAWDAMSRDAARQRQDFLNDATDVTGSALLGMTVSCARCHDHKYDAITQRDYYSLQAFFAGVERQSRELPAMAPRDPVHVAEARRDANDRIARLKSDRESLLRQAREALGPGPDSEVKYTDDGAAVLSKRLLAKVESLRPGALKSIDAEMREAESALRLNAAVSDVVCASSKPPRRTCILKGGELTRPGDEVGPAFIAAMAPAGAATLAPASSRRSALAHWLTSPENPLLARVMVNRIWQHHFGRGIVATPSDFGRNGRQPTHPELLDWLACEFVDRGFSIKQMHRLIMTSSAYRRSAAPTSSGMASDPENHLLWRMDRRRLDAEAIRDSILIITGELNPVAGGPGAYAKLPAGVNVELPNNAKDLSWGTCSEEEGRRRSIYLFQRRSMAFPLMEVFDAAPMNQSCPARPQTTVAPQALALFNGEFARQAAARFAARVRREAGMELRAGIERAWRIAFTRSPSDGELADAIDFLARQAERRAATDGARAGDAAWVDLCHVLINANEFVYRD